MPDPITLSAAEAQALVERVRELVLGLKVLRELAAQGDRPDAAALLQELREVLPQSRIVRLG